MKVDEMAGLEEFDNRYTEVENTPNCPGCGGTMLYQGYPPNAVGFHCRVCERKQDIADIKARNPPQDWDRAIRIYLANTRPRTEKEQADFARNMEADIVAAYSQRTSLTWRTCLFLALPILAALSALVLMLAVVGR